MDSIEARQVVAQVSETIGTAQWDGKLTTAVQRLLGDLHLLNPHDDVDGLMGPRTREGWRFFKERMDEDDPDTIAPASALLLLGAVDDPEGLIGHPKIDLRRDFEFRRTRRQSNRAASVAALIDEARARGLTPPQIAYVLATAEHESDSFNTLEEYASGHQYEGRANLGNDHAGDGVRFKGRGYVQLTGRRNYTSYASVTGLDLTGLPIMLMNWPALSVFVIVDGMLRGAYTGQRLDTFVNSSRQDFVNARRVINGLDRAEKIAAQASDWLAQLA